MKVNAAVDEGVALLVEALNGFPTLQTIESCEGDPDQPAWVAFRYGDGWQSLTKFVFGTLGPPLMRSLGDRVHLVVLLAENGDVYAELTVRSGAMNLVVDALRDIEATRVAT